VHSLKKNRIGSSSSSSSFFLYSHIQALQMRIRTEGHHRLRPGDKKGGKLSRYLTQKIRQTIPFKKQLNQIFELEESVRSGYTAPFQDWIHRMRKPEYVS